METDPKGGQMETTETSTANTQSRTEQSSVQTQSTPAHTSVEIQSIQVPLSTGTTGAAEFSYPTESEESIEPPGTIGNLLLVTGSDEPATETVGFSYYTDN